MSHSSRTAIRLALALVLFFAGGQRAFGAGELEGQIRGRILEEATNLPVPGATVTVTSPGLGEPRVTTSNEEGELLVPNLPIGHYQVAVSYPGVKPIIREVLVQPGVTSPLEIKWSAEMVQTETTTVTEERPVTNPDSTQTHGGLPMDQAQSTPRVHPYTHAP